MTKIKSQISNDTLDTDKIDIEFAEGHTYFIRLPGEEKQPITVGSPYQVTDEEEPRFPIHPVDDHTNDYELTMEALLNGIAESNNHWGKVRSNSPCCQSNIRSKNIGRSMMEMLRRQTTFTGI